jgi:DNA polymerase-3 subunit alpha
VAYQTAWLKHYYPREFMAALMSSEINDSDRVNVLLEECRKSSIEVLPPDVNYSRTDFSVYEGKIRFGLQAVKNVGPSPAQAIVEEREKEGRYADLADLAGRAPARCLNRRILESLISAGACDSLPGNRAQKYAAVESMLEYAHKVAAASTSHDLFADGGGAVVRVAPELPAIDDWNRSERLANEKATLGYWVSGHPLDAYRDELKSFTTFTNDRLKEAPDGREVTIGGAITQVTKKIDKKGNMMAFVTLEDFTGRVELILFSSLFETNREFVEADRMVLVTGRVSTREGEDPKIIANEILPLEKLTERYNCQLVIKLDADCSDKTIERALDALDAYKGNTPVVLAARENGSEVYIRSRKYSVNPDFSLLDDLKAILGETGAYLRRLHKRES